MRLLLLFVVAAIGIGCSAKSAPLLVPDRQERVWCHERDLGEYERCLDGLLDTSGWPGGAVICVDDLYHCASLQDIRSWLQRYLSRLVVELHITSLD